MFEVRPIRCDCHPETCCCDDYEILRHGERVATGSNVHALGEMVTALNIAAGVTAETPASNATGYPGWSAAIRELTSEKSYCHDWPEEEAPRRGCTCYGCISARVDEDNT